MKRLERYTGTQNVSKMGLIFDSVSSAPSCLNHSRPFALGNEKNPLSRSFVLIHLRSIW
jgi:hypothetical protein